MKNYILFTIISFLFFGLWQAKAQNNSKNIWLKVAADKTERIEKIHRSTQPNTFDIYKLDLDILKTMVAQAPLRNTSKHSSTIVSFPMANGKMEQFEVFESPIMHPDLAAKYPMIKTYAAQGIDDPTATMRFSITQFGLHTMTLSGKHDANYIEPYSSDRNYYIVYNRKSLSDYNKWEDFACLTDEGYEIKPDYTSNASRNDTNDQKLRTYRLAQTCTAEYGNIFAGTGTDAEKKANIQAQMAITINRVNEIYERDLAITLQFIANNDVFIYYGDTNADPWNGEYNTKTQEVISTTLNDESLYDIGHNFNTSGGGNAGCISCVCIDASPPYTADSKGRGYTGRADPTGDAFDIDYVAHEMGHQFGGYHTMNTCSRSGNGMTEVEPASGSSIMGYAGICATNVQNHSDAHFNYVNIRDISQNIQTGNSTCGAQTNLANNPPTANAGSDYTIPKSTAFVLEGIGTDPDGTASLTYNWSQNDPEQSPGSAAPQSTYTVGPMYRAILPTTSPKRYMPKLSDVLAGNLTPTWEVTPSVARNMEFSFVVRDNFAGGGQTAADLMNVTVDGNAGPFVVTSQTTATTWNSGENQTITWDVAGTNAGNVNTSTVDIILIIDNGTSFVTAASNVPNNGSYTITVPTGTTTANARIMVKGHNNIFYAVNTGTISIQDSEFIMNFAATDIDTCVPDDVIFSFTYNTFNGFNETTTFSGSGLPTGVSITFNPPQATNDGTNVTATISGVSAANLGLQAITITGTASSATKNYPITFSVYDTNFAGSNLTAPVDNATNIISPITLEWDGDANAQEYTVQIATDTNFTNIIDTATVATNSYQTGVPNNDNTIYYWRIQPSNLCGNGSYSAYNTFTTANIACNNVAATDVPQNIGPGSGTVTNSIVNFPDDLTITDVNVTINLTHTYDADLDIFLIAPDGTTSVELSTDNGGSSENYTNTVFDDDAATSIISGSAPFTGSFQPEGTLSSLNGLSSLGDWTLSITDDANGDSGELISWSIAICGGVTVGVNDYLVDNLVKLYPNPTNGILKIKNEEAIQLTVYDVLGKKLLNNSYDNGLNQIDLSAFKTGVYFVKVRVSGISAVKTYRIIKQ